MYWYTFDFSVLYFHTAPYLWLSYLNWIYFLGTVKVWDVRQENDPVAMMQPKESEAKRDCWAVAFGTSMSYVINVICSRFCLGVVDGSFLWSADWYLCAGNTYTEAERVVAAGYDNGDIKLFDLRSMSVRWETNIKNGVCCSFMLYFYF